MDFMLDEWEAHSFTIIPSLHPSLAKVQTHHLWKFLAKRTHHLWTFLFFLFCILQSFGPLVNVACFSFPKNQLNLASILYPQSIAFHWIQFSSIPMTRRAHVISPYWLSLVYDNGGCFVAPTKGDRGVKTLIAMWISWIFILTKFNICIGG